MCNRDFERVCERMIAEDRDHESDREKVQEQGRERLRKEMTRKTKRRKEDDGRKL